MIIIFVMLCRKKKTTRQISMADSKTTYQNSSAAPHKSLQPSLNILSRTCNLRPSLCGHAVSRAHHCPSYRGLWGGGKKSHNAASFTFTLMSVTWCPSPRRFFFFFSFQKLADPRLVGSFTRMTSSAQTLPTVLNKARACFSVWVPLLHWDCYERCEWEDVCSK